MDCGKWFSKIDDNKIIAKIENFLNGRAFLICLSVFIFIIQLLGLDVIGFSVIAFLFVFATIFCKKYRVSFALVCMAIFCVSTKNSPNRNASGFQLLGKCKYTIGLASTYYSSTPFILFAIFGSIIVIASMVYRLVFFGNYKKVFKSSSLFWGILFLSISFLFAGVGSKGYSGVDFGFGLIQALTFLVVYFYFACTQRKEDFNFDYVADILLAIFFFVVALVMQLYLTRFRGFLSFSHAWKECLLPGWGWALDLGSYITLGIVAIFYKMYKTKYFGFWFAMIIVGIIAQFFTLARGAMLISAMIIVCGFIASLKRVELRKKIILYSSISIILVVLLFLILEVTGNSKYFFDYFKRPLSEIDSGRFEIWNEYWDYFKKEYLFGAGFSVKINRAHILNNGSFSIYSSLAHNVIVQMLGSCGIIGFIGFAVHLVQVSLVCFETTNRSKTYFSVAIFAFIFMSLLDTIFFKAQFTFLYLGLLLVCEFDNEKQKNVMVEPKDVRVEIIKQNKRI